MSRRSARDELEFGSDSFLDIIANIVGILIILIVVAGMRVSKAPVPLMAITSVKEAEPVESEMAEATTLPPQPSPELARRVDEVRAKIASVETEIATRLAELQRLTEEEDAVRRRLESFSRSLAGRTEALEAGDRRIAEKRAALDRLKAMLAELQSELAEAERRKPPVEEIEHRLTPVSKTVDGKEIHFRLAENRVSHVPIEELIDRLRSQVDRQKNWLAKFRRHQGTVGPIGGFTMEYVVERMPLTALEQLRHGRAVMRIGVSAWRLKVEPDLSGESGDEALSRGSAFQLAIKSAKPGTTLTFWVYPDSFPLFRRLQKAAHAEGLTVAARPLPFDAPIAGSPHGSKSSGQ